MPRIRPAVFWRARQLSRQHRQLLPVCRDLLTVRNELKWLTAHAISVSEQIGLPDSRQSLLDSFVARRARHEPLQYILESEFFGDLEIQCRTGVLIPRRETAASITFIARILQNEFNRRPTASPNPLRVLDLCTGTGCIPLLFHHEFYHAARKHNAALELVGVDISGLALSLARKNLIHQMVDQGERNLDDPARQRSLQTIAYIQADVLQDKPADAASETPSTVLDALKRLESDDTTQPRFDILIANPPYISPKEFLRTTSRSVRLYEPKLALVPDSPSECINDDIAIGDRFYPRLLKIAEQVDAKIVLFEVADMAQARRVASIAISQGQWDEIEIWRDEADTKPQRVEVIQIDGVLVSIRGQGHGRSVFARRRSQTAAVGSTT